MISFTTTSSHVSAYRIGHRLSIPNRSNSQLRLEERKETYARARRKFRDEITAAYERGEVTDIAKVMLARQESSVAFEATLQVRNKLLSAYQEIMRMGV